MFRLKWSNSHASAFIMICELAHVLANHSCGLQQQFRSGREIHRLLAWYSTPLKLCSRLLSSGPPGLISGYSRTISCFCALMQKTTGSVSHCLDLADNTICRQNEGDITAVYGSSGKSKSAGRIFYGEILHNGALDKAECRTAACRQQQGQQQWRGSLPGRAW